MMEVDHVTIPIGDSNQQQETIPTETEKTFPEWKSLTDAKIEETESKTNDEEAHSEVSSMQIENEIASNSSKEIKIYDEHMRSNLQHSIYNYISGSCVFLVNKVMIPFGEHVLLNSTVWTILKVALEIFLEMLLYIILAICYVFLKFISQLEKNNKPKKNEEETTVS
ncbi:uncharacterized protein LOC123689049 [Harmonia axyridis]|uniref:uncharacterized protein LOC123689049 n=1 Tax=Harmonia axyridis TaxID=115357 RepID=UPI001E2754EA|nr:uncharacterized protein LOC123689049 [Harmonia axyridis]